MKKKFKLLLCVCLILALTATTFVGCGGGSDEGEGEAPAGEVIKLSWAGIGSTEAIDTWIGEEIAAQVAEATDGMVEITVYPASQLGDYVQAYEEIMQGTIDMGLFTMQGSYDIFAEALYIPFLVKDTEHFKEVYAQDGYLNEQYAAFQAEYGIHVFGYWPSGFVGLGFAKMDDNTKANLFNFDVHKETLVRAPALETMAVVIQDGMNYNTTTINYADLYTALQTGVADGWYGGGPYLNLTSFVEVDNYFVDYKILPDVYGCMMNMDKWNSIPEEYQAVMNEIIIDVLNQGCDKLAQQEEDAIQGLRDAGVEVFIPTDEEKAAMTAYFKEHIWPILGEKYYGVEYMEALEQYVK